MTSQKAVSVEVVDCATDDNLDCVTDDNLDRVTDADLDRVTDADLDRVTDDNLDCVTDEDLIAMFNNESLTEPCECCFETRTRGNCSTFRVCVLAEARYMFNNPRMRSARRQFWLICLKNWNGYPASREDAKRYIRLLSG